MARKYCGITVEELDKRQKRDPLIISRLYRAYASRRNAADESYALARLAIESIRMPGNSDGCATYTARPAPAPKIAAMPFSRIENSVMVAVDPYIQPDRQKEVFDAELKGVLPLYLLVENRGDQKIFLSRSDIALEIPDGRQIGPVHSGAVAHLFMGNTYGGGGPAHPALVIIAIPLI